MEMLQPIIDMFLNSIVELFQALSPVIEPMLEPILETIIGMLM